MYRPCNCMLLLCKAGEEQRHRKLNYLAKVSEVMEPNVFFNLLKKRTEPFYSLKFQCAQSRNGLSGMELCIHPALASTVRVQFFSVVSRSYLVRLSCVIDLSIKTRPTVGPFYFTCLLCCLFITGVCAARICRSEDNFWELVSFFQYGFWVPN